jgi:hypothetical protein
VNTSSLSFGWHTLRVDAFDASGKNSSYELRFYIDGSAPSVVMGSGQTFTSGEDFEVRANVTDEFSVGNVALMYELQDGIFASVGMILNGGDYIASIPSADLHEGMAVYVVATDSAGNFYESAYVALHASSSGIPGDIISNAWTIFGIPIFTLIMICAMIVCSVSIVVFVKRRGTAKRARSRSTASARAQTIAVKAPLPVFAEPFVNSVASSPSKPQISVSRFATPRPLPVAADIEPAPQELSPALIDAIPTVVLKSPEPAAEDEPEMDFGKLIEDELIIPSMKNSVFRETIRDVNAEIEMKLDELMALCEEKPKKTIG